MIKLNRSAKGDTIVEVLVAIAVMSTVLAGAYAISNRNSSAIRQAQEHAEALQIAQTQVEQLKVLALISNTDIFSRTANPGNGFCTFNPGSGDLEEYDDSDPSNKCIVNNGIDYRVSISRENTAAPQYKFTVRVRWDSINGPAGQEDNVELSYKLNKL